MKNLNETCHTVAGLKDKDCLNPINVLTCNYHIETIKNLHDT